MMDISMTTISNLLTTDLVSDIGFSSGELIHLVRAIFAQNEKRAKLLDKIEEEHS